MDEATGTKGDRDPIDALEIGSKIHKSGEVVQVEFVYSQASNLGESTGCLSGD